MFLAGLLPALVMVAFLLLVGGYLRRGHGPLGGSCTVAAQADLRPLPQGRPGRPSGSCRAGGGHRLAGQRPGHAHRERGADGRLCRGSPRRWPTANWTGRLLARLPGRLRPVIGGVMLILGMALA
jgi:C4-dicarboxylate transporter DctM subunit